MQHKPSNNKQFGKAVFIETYGCQMNEYDSELVRSILKKENYEFVTDELAADIVMLNTCAIREHAHRKVYGRVHNIRHARGKDSPVIVAWAIKQIGWQWAFTLAVVPSMCIVALLLLQLKNVPNGLDIDEIAA